MTDYQVLIKVNTQALISAGYMKADGGDIRFASDCGITVVDFYLEGYLNTDSTKLWVKIPSLAPSSSTVRYLFFGNPAATLTSTPNIFNGPHSATDSVVVTSTNTVSNCQRGFRFAPTQNILVTHFGKRIPNSTIRYVTLFDFNTQAIVTQMQVTAGSPGAYNYDPLTNAIWLNSGQQYVIELFNSTGDMYYYGTSSQIGQHLTYFDMKFANSCNQNTFRPAHLQTIITGALIFGII